MMTKNLIDFANKNSVKKIFSINYDGLQKL